MSDEVEEIKKRLDIVELISGYLTIKKAGINYKANCPFHQEKTASFMVSPEKQIFKCFGCGEAGDIYGFLMKMEGLNFVEALEMLANRAGVIIDHKKTSKEYQQEKDIKSRLFQINKLSAQVYHRILLEHSSANEAREYLKKRKLSVKTLKDFMVGFAPLKSILYDFLKKRGFSDTEIRQAGNPDRFKNRIIFPISDQMGNVVGFTGRVLDPKMQPKYLNTPETAIFHKSRILYGLNLAKQFIKKEQTSLVVEGQMDVLASHQVGVNNAVASSGTALTQDHLDILARYAPNIIFAFDQDEAGIKTSKKSIMMAIQSGINTKTIIIPDGFKDAGEIVEKDSTLWKKTVDSSVHVLDWLMLQNFQDNKTLTGFDKKEIAKEIVPFIAVIPDKIEQNHYIKILAKKLDSKEELIIEVINKIIKVSKNNLVNKQKHTLTPQEHLIGLLLVFPELINYAVNKLDYQEFTDSSLSEIYKQIQSCYTKNGCPNVKQPKDSNQKYCDESQSIIKCFRSKLSSSITARLEFLVLEVETLYNNDYSKEDLKKELEKSISHIKHIKNDQIKNDFAQAIKQAESKGNIKQVKELLKEFQNALK